MSWGRPLAVGYYALVEISELGEFACLICWLFFMVETFEQDGDVHRHHHFFDLRWLHRFAGWFRACGEIHRLLR